MKNFSLSKRWSTETRPTRPRLYVASQATQVLRSASAAPRKTLRWRRDVISQHLGHAGICRFRTRCATPQEVDACGVVTRDTGSVHTQGANIERNHWVCSMSVSSGEGKPDPQGLWLGQTTYQRAAVV